MPRIAVLDAQVAELIAAGEVVDRPASVVKELLENAVDAGSTDIRVSIERGGLRRISVQDDGAGIDPEEVPTAFLRHATSKVRGEEDLTHIATLGFRGEALASIAAVSRTEMTTKTDDSEYAVRYAIHGGVEQSAGPAARPRGTTLEIADLFYNTPARMKFLKKDQTESGYVQDVVEKLALSHPHISFSMRRDGKEVFRTPGDGNLLSAAHALFGRQEAAPLLAVQLEQGALEVNGLVTAPEDLRASRGFQYFFVNGRSVKNRTMLAAVEAAYKGLSTGGRFPGCILFLQMPYGEVDVNVHPAKTEVRFASEKTVFDAVYTAVRQVLLGKVHKGREWQLGEKEALSPADYSAVMGNATEPTLSHQGDEGEAEDGKKTFLPQHSQSGYVYPTFTKPENTETHKVAAPDTSAYTEGRQWPPARKMGEAKPGDGRWKEWAEAFFPSKEGKVTEKNFTTTEESQLSVNKVSDSETSSQTAFVEKGEETDISAYSHAQPADLRVIGEAYHTYILLETPEALYLLDKHAAHERLLYDQLKAGAGEQLSQQLLAPQPVTVGMEEKNALLENTDFLRTLGIELSDFGGHSVMVRAVPVQIDMKDIPGLLAELGQRLGEGNTQDTDGEKADWLYSSVACRAAVKAGDGSKLEEMLALSQRILSGEAVPVCPHGRPVLLRLKKREIEKHFDRTR